MWLVKKVYGNVLDFKVISWQPRLLQSAEVGVDFDPLCILKKKSLNS
jgi:hypothetical protein